jgi:hypothetical protein
MASSAETRPRGNGDFAERALPDAKRASRTRDGLGLALAIYFALIVIASLSGAFGTHQIELGPRFAFWTALILWNAMKWHLWLALLAKREGWARAIAVGALVLNLTLPFETRIALGMAPGQPWGEYLGIYSSAVAISLVSGVACTVAVRYFGPARAAMGEPQAEPGRETGTPATAFGVAQGELWAIQAEDHYVRLLLADGRTPLVGGRFGDALANVAHIAGSRIHRGCWVADAAVTGVEREGRGWRIVLPDGTRLAVSASHVGSIRERGWIARVARLAN